MGESACLMHTFSCASDTQHEPKEANPIRSLGESISFGRFTSESLAWEKWSSFNHNRYLEEVEKYSKPGSVAQKKAYFEAHYKKIAEKKAAALLEQANAAANNTPQPENDDGVHNADTPDSNLARSNSPLAVEEPEEATVSNAEVDLPAIAGECDSGGHAGNIGSTMVEKADPEIKSPQVLVENMQIESLNSHEDAEKKKVAETETSTEKQIEKPQKENIDQESSASVSRMRAGSSSKPLVHSRTTKILSSSAGPRTTPVHLWKENNSTPDRKKFVKDSADKKKSMPKSLHMSINLASSRSGDAHKMSSSSFLQRNRDPMAVSNLSKASKDSTNTLQTPARASGNRVPKPPPGTPQSESRRSKPPLEHIPSGSRKMDMKWQSFSVDRSKSSVSWGNKPWSPTVSSCFRFRSEERTVKRKEKLEEKFNAQEDIQLKAKPKEKTENELKKLRQSLNFKAKPMPDFYRETELPKTPIKKIPPTRPRSPKLGRRPSSSAIQDKSSLPPRKPSIKSDVSKLAIEKTVRTTARSVSSLPKRNAHENASPNIQI